MREVFLLTVALALLAGPMRPAAAQLSDEDLSARIIEAIERYPNYQMFDAIEVRVDNRAVTLSGWVTIPQKRDEIVKRVQRIDGIRSLATDIKVLPVSPRDDQLRRQVAAEIYNNPTFWMEAQLPVPPIHIIVDGGKIILTGVVDTDGQRTTAAMLAQRVGGHFGVTNLIRVPRSGRR